MIVATSMAKQTA